MKRRRRVPSPAERALWESAVAAATPLDPPRRAGAAQATPAPDAARSRSDPPLPEATPYAPPEPASRTLRPTGRAEPSLRWPQPRADRPQPTGRSVAGLDGATARKLRRGLRAPDAKLDLHGMTADRAHRALTRFILDGRAAGLRCVLVVTGKGRSAEGGRGDGVLRRDAPRWLETPPLSEAVVHLAEAHPRHGGAGALYVYLKRAR